MKASVVKKLNSHQKHLKLQMSVAGLFLEAQLPKFVRVHFFLCHKNAEIFVKIPLKDIRFIKICVNCFIQNLRIYCLFWTKLYTN